MQTKRPNKKLFEKFDGPFFITKIIYHKKLFYANYTGNKKTVLRKSMLICAIFGFGPLTVFRLNRNMRLHTGFDNQIFADWFGRMFYDLILHRKFIFSEITNQYEN